MIVDKGKFCIPLYHGTSSLFVPSIMEKGLGGDNPILVYDAETFLQTILNACTDCLSAHSDWNSTSYAVDWIIGQKVLKSGANFQHGQLYLTPSRACAERY